MPTKIVAPPKRTGGRKPDLPELPAFIAAFKDLPADDTSWLQADTIGSTEKRNAITVKRRHYVDALEAHFGYKFASQGYTDPDTPTAFRFALAFARDENGDLMKPDGTPDPTANDGKPQTVDTSKP